MILTQECIHKIFTCRVCNTKDYHQDFHVREMFFGSREPFNYFECSHCGTIQICDIPDDLERHYPNDYYSFADCHIKPMSQIGIHLRRWRVDAWLTGNGMVGRFLAWFSKRKPAYIDWFSGIPINTNSNIVDVGCGSGGLLLSLQRDGFQHLSGLDPYLPQSIEYSHGLTVRNYGLAEDVGSYDFIMLHHSFEHMPNPMIVMKHIADHLAPKGRVLIRLPIAGGYAWRTYKEHWFQLDAPRHLVIPTVQAMHILAEQAGLERCFFDSKINQFIASEAYRNDVPMIEQKHLPQINANKMKHLQVLTKKLNREKGGDQGGFVLRRKTKAGV